MVQSQSTQNLKSSMSRNYENWGGFFSDNKHLLVLRLVEHVGEPALATVLTVEVGSHENSSTTLLSGTLTAETVDLAIVVNLVVLEDSQLDLPVLVLDLLGGGVVLLLPLLGTSSQPEDEMEGGLLLDLVLHILDGVRRLHLEGDGLAREGLHKDLHGGADLPDFSCRSESSNKSLVVFS